MLSSYAVMRTRRTTNHICYTHSPMDSPQYTVAHCYSPLHYIKMHDFSVAKVMFRYHMNINFSYSCREPKIGSNLKTKFTVLPNFKYHNNSSSSSKLRNITERFINTVFMRLADRGTPTTREETAG
jgi:hypothetical protein